MRLFGSLYEKTLIWAAHVHAQRYLAGMSFAESSFFPIPVDVMLAPMVLAQPNRAWRYAAIATLASVLGGVFGYFLGMFSMEYIMPFLEGTRYEQYVYKAKEWFKEYGVWVIFVAGFAPIPYKVFTLTAGAVGMALLPFVLASIIGRGARFFLVAGVIVVGGDKFEPILRKHVELLGWLFVILLGFYLLYG